MERRRRPHSDSAASSGLFASCLGFIGSVSNLGVPSAKTSDDVGATPGDGRLLPGTTSGLKPGPAPGKRSNGQSGARMTLKQGSARSAGSVQRGGSSRAFEEFATKRQNSVSPSGIGPTPLNLKQPGIRRAASSNLPKTVPPSAKLLHSSSLPPQSPSSASGTLTSAVSKVARVEARVVTPLARKQITRRATFQNQHRI